jgi:hypothetical protein
LLGGGGGGTFGGRGDSLYVRSMRGKGAGFGEGGAPDGEPAAKDAPDATRLHRLMFSRPYLLGGRGGGGGGGGGGGALFATNIL